MALTQEQANSFLNQWLAETHPQLESQKIFITNYDFTWDDMTSCWLHFRTTNPIIINKYGELDQNLKTNIDEKLHFMYEALVPLFLEFIRSDVDEIADKPLILNGIFEDCEWQLFRVRPCDNFTDGRKFVILKVTQTPRSDYLKTLPKNMNNQESKISTENIQIENMKHFALVIHYPGLQLTDGIINDISIKI